MKTMIAKKNYAELMQECMDIGERAPDPDSLTTLDAVFIQVSTRIGDSLKILSVFPFDITKVFKQISVVILEDDDHYYYYLETPTGNSKMVRCNKEWKDNCLISKVL